MSTGRTTEDERSSLLASTSVSAPSAPKGQQEPQRWQDPQRQSMKISALEEMERGARRLADEVVGDSDSINGLLAGMEGDEEEEGGGGLSNSDGGGMKKRVTATDLSYLQGLGADNDMADEIGDELLLARDEGLEQDILRRSLNLSTLRTAQTQDLGSRPADRHGTVDEAERCASYALKYANDDKARQILERLQRSSMRLRTTISGDISVQSAEIEPSGDAEGKKRNLLEPEKFFILPGGLIALISMALFVLLVLAAVILLATLAMGPPSLPIGSYQLVEAQVGESFWDYYDFYAGKDSAGSNGYITYVSREKARSEGIAKVVTEDVVTSRMIEIYEDGDPRAVEDWLAEDLVFLEQLRRKELDDSAREEEDLAASDSGGGQKHSSNSTITGKKRKEGGRRMEGEISNGPPPRLEAFNPDPVTNATNTTAGPTETFVVISSSPTKEGPRNSVRLEGRRRFNRGLFIIDLRHMPAGCGTWPAFWLTDEANWPVNGEIDIVEGVNYQDTAKTALHATRECVMDDVAEGSKTGSWDTSIGIPDRKTGIPDMTFRWAQNCFVYDPHQWLNQGCVATDLKLKGRSLGMPLNDNGGGVYALEWDGQNRHIRTWVFSPHNRVPSNLRDAMRTATLAEGERIAPDTNLWGLPYGNFPIGEGTNCPASHFKNMRLVINLAFCGSVAGNRYFMDCPTKYKKFKTCEQYLESQPEELKEAYWKIRGVYVYEREWVRQWN